MVDEGWRGYTEQECELALFVQQRVFQHYNLTDENRERLRAHLALVALSHLRREGRIRFEVPEAEMFEGFPPDLPPPDMAREETDVFCRLLGLSVPLKDLLYLMVLVEVTCDAAREGRITWLAPPR